MSRGVMGTSLCTDPLPAGEGLYLLLFLDTLSRKQNQVCFRHFSIFPLKTFHLSKKFQVKLIHFLVGFGLGLSDCL